MFSAGIGQINHSDLKKKKPKEGNLIVRLGGPAYNIGVGGSVASSKEQYQKDKDKDKDKEEFNFDKTLKEKDILNKSDGIPDCDLSAVQRGDPEMGNKLNKVIRCCIDSNRNPIRSIHDQGAGGMGNVTKEIVEPLGADIDLGKVHLGDKSMTDLEIWISEHQEQNTVLVEDGRDLEYLKLICNRENLPMSIIGKVNKSGIIKVKSHFLKDKKGEAINVVELPLKDIFNLPIKNYKLKTDYVKSNLRSLCYIKEDGYTFDSSVPCYLKYKKSLKDISYKDKGLVSDLCGILGTLEGGCKLFLTSKVDRSVTGLISQQQCIGRYQFPLSNYCTVAQSHYGYTGVVSSVGEKPMLGLLSVKKMVRMAVGEMITNLIFSKVSNFYHIRCQANWMWVIKEAYEKEMLYIAGEVLSKTILELGIAIDGGKDSLNMAATVKNCLYEDGSSNKNIKIKSPRQMVLTSYVTTPDIRKKITPDFKRKNSYIFFIDLGFGKARMSGSLYKTKVCNSLGIFEDTPDFKLNNISILRNIFIAIQDCIDKDLILAGHDRSDGGLITSLCEMSFTSGIGCNINLKKYMNDVFTNNNEISDEEKLRRILFNEELGLILEVDIEKYSEVCSILIPCGAPIYLIGNTINKDLIYIQGIEELKLSFLRSIWLSRSYYYDKKQTINKYIEDEYNYYEKSKGIYLSSNKEYSNILVNDLYNFELKFKKEKFLSSQIYRETKLSVKPKVCILREEGSNGDKEMASYFDIANFEVWDFMTSDLLLPQNVGILKKFNMLVFVGGFSYADVLGGANGWAQTILKNNQAKKELEDFYSRKDTLSMGVCNGCQLMIKLGIFGDNINLIKNKSGRFESRFLSVKIKDNSNTTYFNNMNNLSLGIWSAHGEGQFIINKKEDKPLKFKEILHYVDDYGKETELYPFNPNGSRGGLAGIISLDGRHLALMPHPERSFMRWQLPYVGIEDHIVNNEKLEFSGWMGLVINCYNWFKFK